MPAEPALLSIRQSCDMWIRKVAADLPNVEVNKDLCQLGLGVVHLAASLFSETLR